MEEQRFTKAPWSISGNFLIVGAVNTKKGYVPWRAGICNLEQGSYVGMEWDEMVANAKLISTAPELLELALLVQKSFGGGNVITFSERDIERFNEVLKKALGE